MHWAQPNTDGSLVLALDLRSNSALRTGVQVGVRQMFSEAVAVIAPRVSQM
jgi:hypothetical protein